MEFSRIPDTCEPVSDFVSRVPRSAFPRVCGCLRCRQDMDGFWGSFNLPSHKWSLQFKWPFRRISLRRTIKILSESLLLSLCLLSVVRVPAVTSAPTTTSPPAPSTSKWLNPCGLDDTNLYGYEGTGDGMADTELLDNIIVQAKYSLLEAQIIKEEYDNLHFTPYHESWQDIHFDWLPNRQEMPKQIGQNLEEEHLQQQVMELALKNSYQFLQKVAVGLEQVVQDQETYGGEFLGRFNKTEMYLTMVLCEIHMAILEKGAEPSLNVQSDIMTYNFRKLPSPTQRILRDWIILREYVNVLEYIKQVFEHIRNRDEQTKNEQRQGAVSLLDEL